MAKADPSPRTKAVLLVLILLLAPSLGRADDEEPAVRVTPRSHALLDSVRVRHGDSRPTESLPVRHTPEGAYLSLGDFGHLLESSYTWDPETYRGSLEVDSVEVSFVLDSPFLWAGARTIQTSAPVRYAEENLWLPLEMLDLIVAPVLGKRGHWDPESGSLVLAAPEPWLKTFEIQSSGERVVLEIGPVPEAERLRWDPAGRLLLEMRGLHLPPDFRPPESKPRGIERLEAEPTSNGLQLLVYLEPGWLGMRARRSAPGGNLTVELTRSAREASSTGFEKLGSYIEPLGSSPWRQRRRILIEISFPEEYSGQGSALLEGLAQEVRRELETGFGHEVVFLADRQAAGHLRGPQGVLEVPPVPEGDCWIGLRLERYATEEAREFLIVSPGAATRWEALSLGSRASSSSAEAGESASERTEPGGRSVLASARPVPWGQAARLQKGGSNSLARTLADHLRAEIPGRPVRTTGRPARIFRGLGMPAVLIYPTLQADQEGIAELCEPARLTRIARSLAFALDEFFLGQAAEQ